MLAEREPHDINTILRHFDAIDTQFDQRKKHKH